VRTILCSPTGKESRIIIVLKVCFEEKKRKEQRRKKSGKGDILKKQKKIKE